MKIFTILLTAVMLAGAAAASDSLRLTYGYGSASEEGYLLDTALIVKIQGSSYDTIWGPTDSVRNIDTVVELPGYGYVTYELIGVYNGYPGESYTIKEWPVPISVAAVSTGGGRFSLTFLAVDTVNDSAIPFVDLMIKTLAGSDYRQVTTGTDGSVSLSIDSGVYVVSGSSVRYDWEQYDTVSMTADLVDTIMGYATFDLYTIAAPADSLLCTIYGTVFDYELGKAKYRTVLITVPRQFKSDADSTIILMPETIKLKTDKNGFFSTDVLKSCYLPDSAGAFYKITVGDKVKTEGVEVWIPADSGTYQVDFF